MKKSILSSFSSVKRISSAFFGGQQKLDRTIIPSYDHHLLKQGVFRLFCTSLSMMICHSHVKYYHTCLKNLTNTGLVRDLSSFFKSGGFNSIITNNNHHQQFRNFSNYHYHVTRNSNSNYQEGKQQQPIMKKSSDQDDPSFSSSLEGSSPLILYNSKYPHFIHRFLIQPYQRNKTHLYNALITSGLFYTIYEYDIDVNWFLALLWLMGSSYLSYSSHVHNINHIPLVLTKLEYDSKKKVLILYDDRGQVIDKITDFRNLILDNALEFKVHMPLAGFFWKSFLLNRHDMTQRYALKFLHFNANQAKQRAVAGDFGAQQNISERMKQDKITSIDPETGVMRQYVYMVVNSNPQVIQELREDLEELRQEHVKSSKWPKW